MNGLNKVILVGTLGSDPKSSTSREGKGFATLSLATNRYWRNKDGNLERKTDWHKVNVWGKKAELCIENLKKGASVCVEGFLSTYETDDGGQKRWQTSVNAEEVNFLIRGGKNQAKENLDS